MMLFVHGAAGGWDELIIAAVGFGVLWLAVKLAGRKPAVDDDEQAAVPAAVPDEVPAEVEAASGQPAPPQATKSG